MTASSTKQSALTARPVTAASEQAQMPERSGSEEQPQRETLIAEAAFFIALERGFVPGRELDDWLAAEHQVDQRLSATQH